MSVDQRLAGAGVRSRPGSRRVLLAFLLSVVHAAWAAELTAPFADPLGANPALLERGAVPPGDSAPVRCPASHDWSRPLALADAVDLALCGNPRIQAAWAGIKLQAAAVGQARAAYLPTLTANVNRLTTRTSYSAPGLGETESRGDTVYGALNWRLFDFGARDANRQAAGSLLLAAMASHEAELEKTLAATIQAYFDGLNTRAAWTAKIEGAAIAQATLDSARRREARGAAAGGDALQATTALAKATLDRSRAQGAYRKALAVLVYAMGVAPETTVELAADESEAGNAGMPAPSSAARDDLRAWLDAALASHPEILAARAQSAAAQSKIASTRAEGLPTVDFSANYYKNGYPGQGLSSVGSRVATVGIAVSFPLFDGFSHTYKVRQAQAQAEQAQDQLADTEHSVAMEVTKVYADATASLENLQASQTLLTAALESLASSQRKYEKGAADILEILNAQAALADARQQRVSCLAEWQSARLRLLANTGQLGRTEIGR